jgi:predicted Fe-S protein YdhL (DUF1289 family)
MVVLEVQGKVDSPCKKICKVSEDKSHCTVCLRTLQEISRWGSMSDKEKQSVLKRITMYTVATIKDDPLYDLWIRLADKYEGKTSDVSDIIHEEDLYDVLENIDDDEVELRIAMSSRLYYHYQLGWLPFSDFEAVSRRAMERWILRKAPRPFCTEVSVKDA